jgi:hypothetical protein
MDISLIKSSSSLFYNLKKIILKEIHNKTKQVNYFQDFRNAIVVVERIRRSGVFVNNRLCIKGAD